MPVGREVRHALPVLRQEKREVILYPNDMTVDGATLTTLGNSPVLQCADAADQYALANLRVPVNRVPYTPIRLRPVFAMTTAGEDGNVLWYISYLVTSLGMDLTGALGTLWEAVGAPAVNLIQIADGMDIPAGDIDGHVLPVDVQMRVGRSGAHALDTSSGVANLLKLIAEYQAYV